MAPHEIPALDADQISEHMRDTVALSLAEVDNGGIPFSGMVVHPRLGVLGTGVNRVFRDRDPSAHAEIVALRAAVAGHRAALGESLLFASGEPCGMCYREAFRAGISTVLYAVDAEEAARYGFDYLASHRRLDRGNGGTVTRRRWRVEEALTPFTTWARHHG
ncbi:nucleoside deaminase [Halostreptopolyspora alba]|uniref:Nucleoside deaminase n=1 Tax=Halostreptopolyspora alba TaxID=2487137 RepID=A0A3N0E901_9ACTN|nr:nucleoside deaminase [Nocardiopsaceae bacterium YIM 96095]